MGVDEEEGDATDSALIFQESVVRNCTVRYFGDVSGDIGQTYGLSQNGSRIIGSHFLVQDPIDVLPHIRLSDIEVRGPIQFRVGWWSDSGTTLRAHAGLAYRIRAGRAAWNCPDSRLPV